jgi:hypothetical protein
MSGVAVAIFCGVLAGLMVAEITEMTPRAAKRIVRQAAIIRYGQKSLVANERAEDWVALIDARPGNLLKLITAMHFGGIAVGLAFWRSSKRFRAILVLLKRGAAFGLRLVSQFLFYDILVGYMGLAVASLTLLGLFVLEPTVAVAKALLILSITAGVLLMAFSIMIVVNYKLDAAAIDRKWEVHKLALAGNEKSTSLHEERG